MLNRLILGIIMILALCSQGCVTTLTALTAVGVLSGKGYFMYREAGLKEDLQEKTFELNKLKLELESRG